MVLLCVEPPFKISAEIVPAENTQSKDHSFVLLGEFTNKHQINLVSEDKQKKHAIFVT